MIARFFIVALLLLSSRGLLPADPANGHVRSISGTAVMTTPDGKSESVKANMAIPPGSKIQTGATCRMIVEWLPGAFSVLYPNSTVTASSLNNNKQADGAPGRLVALRLTRGTLYSHLTHRDGASDFRVTTPEGVAAARGTDWFVSMLGGVVTVTSLADTVTVTLPSGRVVSVKALFKYIMGDPNASRITEAELNDLLQALRDAGLTVTLQDINDPTKPILPGTATSGYIITYAPPNGDGFQFFVPRWVNNSDDDWLHNHDQNNGEPPLPSNYLPPVPPASR